MKRHTNHVKNSACIISSYHWEACSKLWPNKTSSHRRFSPAGPGWSAVCWWCKQWCGGTPGGVVWAAGFRLCGLHEGPGDQWTGIWPCFLCQETRLRWERDFVKPKNSQKHYAVKCYICTSQTCWLLKDLDHRKYWYVSSQPLTASCFSTGSIVNFCHSDGGSCSSNPCMHGGSCREGWGRFICDCSHTSFVGPTCGKGKDSQEKMLWISFNCLLQGVVNDNAFLIFISFCIFYWFSVSSNRIVLLSHSQ